MTFMRSKKNHKTFIHTNKFISLNCILFNLWQKKLHIFTCMKFRAANQILKITGINPKFVQTIKILYVLDIQKKAIPWRRIVRTATFYIGPIYKTKSRIYTNIQQEYVADRITQSFINTHTHTHNKLFQFVHNS